MGKIIILDENTSNKIAAGEVIERPASVVKELVENSIDAGAGNINVEIRNGGISFIRVSDNGCGIEEDDAVIAFERHATSKIRSASDLESISTMGFRGEALASIAAVSKVELTSRVNASDSGIYLEVQGGVVKEVRQAGCSAGTTFIIRDLFYNTPARYKFLKRNATEAGYVSDIMGRIAIGNPKVSFTLTSNDSAVMHTPGNGDLLSAIFSVYGKDAVKNIHKIEYRDEDMRIFGYAGSPEAARSNRNQQSVYLNGRYVRSRIVTSAVDEAYKTFLMKNRYALVVLCIETNPVLVDVNVHPTKMEVRFSDEQRVFRSVYHAVNNAISSGTGIRTPEFSYRPGIQDPPAKDGIREDSNCKPGESGVESNAASAGGGKKQAAGEDQGSIFEKSYPSRNNILKKENNIDGRFIGQVFSTYIILEQGEDMLIVDQHAMHERLIYERLKKGMANAEPMEQMLLAPVSVELTQQELVFIRDNVEFFRRIGFVFEDFGSNSVLLRSVPAAGNFESVKAAFIQAVDRAMDSSGREGIDAADEVLYTIACKAAVKANMKLDELEVRNLLREISGLDNPYTCPHGRPSVLRLTKQELEKMFKRIV